MIDRYLLRYFLAVVDHGNFSAAARHCRVSQPSLSIGIARLEDLLGRPVFTRTNRRVELTAAGARLVTPARRIEADFAEAERVTLDDAPVATIRIGLMSTLPDMWVEEAVASARLAATERVEIVDARAKEIPALLERGRIDAGIGLRQGDNLPGFDLWTEGYAIALSSAHPLSGRRSLRAEDVAAETMFVRRDCEALTEISRHFTSRGIRPFMAARTRSEGRAVSYVRSGLGITVMPSSFASRQIALVPMEGFGVARTVGIMLPRGKADLPDRSPALARMLSALRTRAAEAQGVQVKMQRPRGRPAG